MTDLENALSVENAELKEQIVALRLENQNLKDSVRDKVADADRFQGEAVATRAAKVKAESDAVALRARNQELEAENAELKNAVLIPAERP